MSVTELCGKWKLDKERVTAIAQGGNGDDLSWILRAILQSMGDVELIILKKSTNDKESILVCIYGNGKLLSQEYLFINAFNFRYTAPSVPMVSLLKNCSNPTTTFSVQRLGPQVNQKGLELFTLEHDNSMSIRLLANEEELHASDESSIFTRYFHRDEAFNVDQSVDFHYINKTLGWGQLSFWPTNSVAKIKLSITKVQAIKAFQPTNTTLLWNSGANNEHTKTTNYDSDMYLPPQNIIQFTFQVTYGSQTWIVCRIFEELRAIIDFFRLQCPWSNNSCKALPALTFKNYIDLHRHVLNVDNILRFVLRAFSINANMVNQNVIVGLLNFFEIPEHIDSEQIEILQRQVEEIQLQRSKEEDITDISSVQSRSTVDTSATNSRDQHEDATLAPFPTSLPTSISTTNATVVSKPKVDLNTLVPPPVTPLQKNNIPSPIKIETSLSQDSNEAPHQVQVKPQYQQQQQQYQQQQQQQHQQQQQQPAGLVITSNSGDTLRRNSFRRPNPLITERSRQALQASSNDAHDDDENTTGVNKAQTPTPKVELLEIYQEPNVGLKYLPIDVVSSPTMKESIARGLLFGALRHGISIIKHGRQGKPKRKLLVCDQNITRLYWLNEGSEVDEGEAAHDRFIELNQVLYVRKGIEIDPTTSREALERAQVEDVVPKKLITRAADLKNALESDPEYHQTQKKSMFSSIFSSNKDNNHILYGTSNLRRSCRSDELKLCLSLILPARTFDIQCLNQKDYNLLLINLREIVKPRGMYGLCRSDSYTQINVNGNNTNPMKDGNGESKYHKTPTSPRKSVRFIADENGSPITDKKRSTNATSNAANISNNNVTNTNSDSAYQGESMVSLTGSERVIFNMGSDGDLDHLLDSRNGSAVINAHSIDDDDDNDDNEVSKRKASPMRMSSTEALQIGLILCEQEKKYGTNMYESLEDQDKERVQRLVNRGMTTEEAILRIFEHRQSGTDLNTLEAEEHKSNDDGEKGLTKKKSSFFPNLLEVPDNEVDQTNNTGAISPTNRLRMKGAEALQIGLLLGQQENEHGENMYDLTPQEEEEVRQLVQQGISADEAALQIFNRKHYPSATVVHAETVVSQTQATTQPHQHNTTAAVAVTAGHSNAYQVQAQQVAYTNNHGSEFFPNATTVLPGNMPVPVNNVAMVHDPNIQMHMQTMGMQPMHQQPMYQEQPVYHQPMQPVVNHVSSNGSVSGAGANVSSNSSAARPKGPRKLSSDEAVCLAMMLSEQESQHGTNMYDSLTPEDEPELQILLEQNHTLESAVLELFNRKYCPSAANNPNTNNNRTTVVAQAQAPTALAIPAAYPQMMPDNGYGQQNMYMHPMSPQGNMYGYPPNNFNPYMGQQSPGYMMGGGHPAYMIPGHPQQPQGYYNPYMNMPMNNMNMQMGMQMGMPMGMPMHPHGHPQGMHQQPYPMNMPMNMNMPMPMGMPMNNMNMQGYDPNNPNNHPNNNPNYQYNPQLQMMHSNESSNNSNHIHTAAATTVHSLPQNSPASSTTAQTTLPTSMPVNHTPQHRDSSALESFYGGDIVQMDTSYPNNNTDTALTARNTSFNSTSSTSTAQQQQQQSPQPTTNSTTTTAPNTPSNPPTTTKTNPPTSTPPVTVAKTNSKHPPSASTSGKHTVQRAPSMFGMFGSGGKTNSDNNVNTSGTAPPERKVARKVSIFARKNSMHDSSQSKSKLKYRESDVQVIVGMGFNREQAIWALFQNNNNISAAIESLTG